MAAASAHAGVYRQADMTLCLGNAAEGFGLVAAESVACGTPYWRTRSDSSPACFRPVMASILCHPSVNLPTCSQSSPTRCGWAGDGAGTGDAPTSRADTAWTAWRTSSARSSPRW